MIQLVHKSVAAAVLLLVLLHVQPARARRKTLCFQSNDSDRSIYDFSLMDIHKEHMVNLSRYSNQYLALSALQRDLKNFQVLGFPCNQFGKQEPGANGTEILNTLKYVRPGNGFEPAFDMFEKIEVNGQDEHPLYSYLKAYCPPVQEAFNTEGPGIYYKPYKNSDVRWNFEKFLINKMGVPVLRYHTGYLPEDIRKDIEDLLAEREIDPFTFF
ncbi:hypothetical protein BaRGS_00029662 [Batillaria attramentaria]|uniref:Glutathione peroxidase n=1 Tax=Batillaria attramentaria TaxID=370345 RepID=A0ABD0JWP5_9CAEN